MNDVTELSISLAYDPDTIKLDSIQSNLTDSIVEINNEAGFKTLVMSFETPKDIFSETELLSLTWSKETDSTSYINMIQTNFTDSTGELYLLSSSWVIY